MATQPVFNLQALNLGVSPLLQNQGEFIRLVNMDTFPIGAKKKRPGYQAFLTNTTNAQVNSLFEFRKDDGTTFYLYKASGSTLEYSTQGTGPWTIAGNGTIAAGAHVGFGTENNTLIMGDGVGSTRHTTNGTSFTDTSLAPVMSRFVDYQGRIYGIGTSSTMFYSTTNDATNWNLSGTSDSSSIIIPGGGKLLDVFKVANNVTTTKTSGAMHRWDGFNLFDLATNLGQTSPYSVANFEDYRIYLNRLGYYGFNGIKPNIISNSIQNQVYNDSGSGIAGTSFDNAPGGIYKYLYMSAVGTISDELTGETLTNALHAYNFQYDQWSNYTFGTLPTAFCKYKDISGNEQTIFGDASGQCYTYGGTNTSDNGLPIPATLEFIYHDGLPHLEKEFNYFWAFFNPGCGARIQIAISNTYSKSGLKWIDLGDALSGVVEYKFPSESGRLLFVKVTETSTSSRFIFYGCAVDYDPIERK